jgi:hypothetical protein
MKPILMIWGVAVPEDAVVGAAVVGAAVAGAAVAADAVVGAAVAGAAVAGATGVGVLAATQPTAEKTIPNAIAMLNTLITTFFIRSLLFCIDIEWIYQMVKLLFLSTCLSWTNFLSFFVLFLSAFYWFLLSFTTDQNIFEINSCLKRPFINSKNSWIQFDLIFITIGNIENVTHLEDLFVFITRRSPNIQQGIAFVYLQQISFGFFGRFGS